MPAITETTRTPRKDLHIFYVMDTSGSMEGAKISALNHAMEECISALRDLAKTNADANLKIAVLEFNTKCKEVTNGPENLEGDFLFNYFKAGGVTNIGKALEMLDEKLSTDKEKGWLGSMVGALMPVIIFMTDGRATDDYQKALEHLKTNKWFTKGTKIGFALGEDADEEMIKSIVGNSEAVVKTSDLDTFKRLIQFASVRASMLASQSKTDNKTFVFPDDERKNGGKGGGTSGGASGGTSGGTSGGSGEWIDNW